MLTKLVFVFVSLVALADSGNIPDYIHICRRSDPEVAKCIRESIEFLRPQLKQGIPELNVPGIEPLFIKEVAILRGQNNNFKAFLRNINVYGASNFEITKLKLNVDKFTYRVGVKIPSLMMNGDYDIDAKILVVPIKGSGKFRANATNCEGQAILKADVKPDENGIKRFKFTSFLFSINVGDYNIELDNLFNGDPTLSQAALDVLHQNKQEFIAASLPFINAKASEIFLEIANSITNTVDYDEIFPK
ncbi:circadian clock-controlled protein daywake-like [Coccinella septempunctata]|uniref:circadian clock-controlled protein daywake-like n=1 Tax=Coccinella septempunctata TaxID=41139 RepID=UPI001D0959F3|nr:circadian clock-controlled protein daywake-like [Coccinella septempunctata]